MNIIKKDTNLFKPSPLHRGQWMKKSPVTDLGHRIISAAVDEFAVKGVLGARVAEITRLAGTTDPAFYRYFAGIKQAVLFIMSEHYWAPLNLRLNHYQQVSHDPLQLLEAVIEALMHSAEDNPSNLWLAESKIFSIVVAQMRNPTLLPESLLDTEYLHFINKLELIINLGQQQKIFASDLRPYLVAQSLVTSLHSLILQHNLALTPLEVEYKEIKKLAHRVVGIIY